MWIFGNGTGLITQDFVIKAVGAFDVSLEMDSLWDQAGFKLAIFLPHPLKKCQDFKLESPYLDPHFLLGVFFFFLFKLQFTSMNEAVFQDDLL